jgi:hypothetical protein
MQHPMHKQKSPLPYEIPYQLLSSFAVLFAPINPLHDTHF